MIQQQQQNPQNKQINKQKELTFSFIEFNAMDKSELQESKEHNLQV